MTEWYLEFNRRIQQEHCQRIEEIHDASLATIQATLNNKNAKLNNLRRNLENSIAANNESCLNTLHAVLNKERAQTALIESARLSVGNSRPIVIEIQYENPSLESILSGLHIG